MKEFSQLIPQGEDRKFELGGEVYEWVVPYWGDLALIYDEDVALTKTAVEALDNEEIQLPSTGDNIQRTQTRIKLFLAEEDHERFDALCQRKSNPVPLHMWGQVFTWLMEVATGRPTPQPSASDNGGGSGEASSQGASPSRAGSRRR